jgi:hypothetical protein
MPLPNFVGIGAQRAATTWAYNCLKEHPEVFVPDVKELRFFNVQFHKGVSWYESQFQPSSNQKAIGEITPNYLNSELAIPRMAEVIPYAYLFVILREPVQRAISAYKLLYEKQYKGMSFREACERSDNLIKLGLYAEHLQRVFRYYDKSAVKIFLYDDIHSNPAKMLSELFCFLQVDDTFCPRSAKKTYNSITFPNTQGVLRAVRLGFIVDSVKETVVGEWIKKRRAVGKYHNNVGADEEFILHLKKKFRDDILKLQELIERDLSHWL